MVFYTKLWSQPVWTGMPMAIEGKEWLPEGNPVKPFEKAFNDSLITTAIKTVK